MLVVACGKKAEQDDGVGILKYVPADTPYVMVKQGQLPDDLYEELEPHLDRILASYRKMMRAAVESAQADDSDESPDDESLQKASAIIAELDQLLSLEGLESAGIDRESHLVLFGNGLLPVFRITLSDGALLESALARLEERAGEKMSTASIDGQAYRYAGDDEWRVIVAVISNELVLTFAPNPIDDEQLGVILGLTLPAENIAAAGMLERLSDRYSFENYIIGLIDIETIAATFINEPTGINALILGASDFEVTDLDDVCRAEIMSIAGVMPRLVGGYTGLTSANITSKAVLELRDDIASGMMTFSNAVPGLGLDQGGLLSFGMSFDLLAMREFYAAQLDALEANPFQCELLAGIQDGVASGRQALSQPVPPIAYGLKGFLAVVEAIEGMDIQNDIPPTSVDARLLVSTDNAEGLLAMGAMFSPELAALNPKPGDDPVRLDLPVVATTGQTIFAAISDAAIALSVGEGMEDGLKSMLEASLVEPAPVLSVDFDTATYYNFIYEGMAASASEDETTSPAMAEAIQELVLAPQDIFSRIKVDVYFTEHGFEIASDATLKK